MKLFPMSNYVVFNVNLYFMSLQNVFLCTTEAVQTDQRRAADPLKDYGSETHA